MTNDPTNLDRLHDIVVPPPVPWWPPAVGWYWLGGILLIALIWAATHAFIAWQRNRYRREALAEWRRLSSKPTVESLAAQATLLKRTALSVYPRQRVASLTGDAWLAFLDRTSGMRDAFASPTGGLIERASYGLIEPQQIDASQARQVATLVGQWLRKHRRDGGDAS